MYCLGEVESKKYWRVYCGRFVLLAQTERAINPYLRCGEPALRAFAGPAAQAGGGPAMLAAVRARKDRWGTDAALASAVLGAARWLPPLARWLGVEP